MTVKTVCVVVGSRANYSSIKSVLRALEQSPKTELQLVVGASAVLDRYGSVVDLIEADGFNPLERVFMLIEGEIPLTMAKSTGIGLMELPTVFDRLRPDIVLTVGDRFETMATTLAAAYMNIPVAHTMGGEVSGTIDESIRHAVTKFAHIHFPANQDAANRIIRLGEDPETVHVVGCPRIDLVVDILEQGPPHVLKDIFGSGVGDAFDLGEPFVLVSQHPVTSEYGSGEKQITATLEAVKRLGLPAIVLWPNADAGADAIARGIRRWREQGRDKQMHFFKNLPTEVYVWLMRMTGCLVGNSSSGIRESAFIGTPTVNIGSRQNRRMRGKNVIDVGYDSDAIHDAMARQIKHGFYVSESVYGDGRSGEKIVEILATASPSTQKTICY